MEIRRHKVIESLIRHFNRRPLVRKSIFVSIFSGSERSCFCVLLTSLH